MATRQRKAGPPGRTTPKGAGPKGAGPKGGKPTEAAGKLSPSERAKQRAQLKAETPVAVGRRPSSAGFLAVVAVMWMAVGVILFLTLTTGWRLIPAIVAFGVGVLFLRGTASTVLRRERRSSEK